MNLFKRLFQKKRNLLDYVPVPSAIEVEEYYERETENYLKTYGNIIQANRPFSDKEFLDHFINSMGLKDNMRLLDGGCGVCGLMWFNLT